MDISKIISIPGMPGLYKIIGQSKNGMIVESLIDKKRFPAFASHRVSSLEEISIYTSSEDLPLKEVFKKILEKENSGTCPDPKTMDEAGLRSYFETIVPDYDKERVHFSDLKKLFSWYNILQPTGLLSAEETKEEGEDEKAAVADKTKTPPVVKKEPLQKQNLKTNAPKVKPQGVRKTGTA